MGLNQRFGYDRRKVDRFGKFFAGIDFELNDFLKESEYRNGRSKSRAGKFIIGGREYNLTVKELERISETANTALETIHKKYKLGRLSKG